MAIRPRNQLTGRISDIQLGEVMAHISVPVGKNVIESVITRRSTEQLNLKNSDTVSGRGWSFMIVLEWSKYSNAVRGHGFL